jgi:putative membrane protein
MSWMIKIAWIGGVFAVIGLVLSAGAEPIVRAIEAAGWGVAAVCLLRAIAVAGAGAGWFALFPRGLRPSVLTFVAIRFLREGANALLPLTLVGGNVIGARALTLRGVTASLSAASVVVDVLLQAITQSLFAIAGLATLAAIGNAKGLGGTLAVAIALVIPALSGFYFLQRPVGQRLVKTLLTRLVGERQWLSFGAIDSLYARLDSLYANRAGLLRAAAIHMIFWFVGALEIWAMLFFMGLPANYPEALVIESLTQAIRGAAFAIPGALGAQEGGLVAICAIFGVPADVAIAMSLIKRVPDVVFGVPSLIGWQILEGRALLAVGRVAEATRGGQ